MSMADSVQAALGADPIATTDVAVAQLALLYADTIDEDPAMIKDLGPKLLAALESLQLSPRARALARVHALSKGTTDGTAAGRRDDLADIRAARTRQRNA
jgi:hypothetical protein